RCRTRATANSPCACAARPAWRSACASTCAAIACANCLGGTGARCPRPPPRPKPPPASVVDVDDVEIDHLLARQPVHFAGARLRAELDDPRRAPHLEHKSAPGGGRARRALLEELDQLADLAVVQPLR